jgi:uncharacterized membrane protein
MHLRWRELLRSNVDAERRWDRCDSVALALAVFTIVWVFALKLKTFYDLGYSSDLFVSVQLARSWLEGRGLLQDNCFGNTLATHTYFLLVPLGLIAKPFGAPGLLFVLAASAGAAYFWAVRVLRVLGVAGPLALIATVILLASPLSVGFYQEAFYGFHIEDLTPALCLILFYFLLRRRMLESVVLALTVMAVKEDAPIAAGLVAIIAGVETWTSSTSERVLRRVNWPAMVTLVLSVLAIPLLLAISWSQPATMYAPHSVDRIWIVRPGTLRDPGALFLFIGTNLTHWLGSSVVRQWFWVMIVGSFGMILLRPYYLIAGVVTTLVAWLVLRKDLLWTPRFHLTEALLWCVTLVGFASLVRAITLDKTWVQVTAIAAAIVIAAVSASAQFALVPTTSAAYFIRRVSPYSSLERQQADELFGGYRRDGKSEEPVVASPTLFRYAHDRNLFWLDRMIDRPAPMWILSDGTDSYGYRRYGISMKDYALVDRWGRCMLRINDYTVVDRRGRFMLLKKRESQL